MAYYEKFLIVNDLQLDLQLLNQINIYWKMVAITTGKSPISPAAEWIFFVAAFGGEHKFGVKNKGFVKMIGIIIAGQKRLGHNNLVKIIPAVAIGIASYSLCMKRFIRIINSF